MSQKETIRRILKEELGDIKSNYEKQAKLIKKLLDGKSYEGVCDYMFIADYDDNDRVGSVMITFSEEWYRSNDETQELNRKFKLVQTTKDDIGKLISRFLGIKDLYVGSYMGKCGSSLGNKELTT